MTEWKFVYKYLLPYDTACTDHTIGIKSYHTKLFSTNLSSPSHNVFRKERCGLIFKLFKKKKKKLGTVLNFQLLSTLEQRCGLLPQEMGLFTGVIDFLFHKGRRPHKLQKNPSGKTQNCLLSYRSPSTRTSAHGSRSQRKDSYSYSAYLIAEQCGLHLNVWNSVSCFVIIGQTRESLQNCTLGSGWTLGPLRC